MPNFKIVYKVISVIVFLIILILVFKIVYGYKKVYNPFTEEFDFVLDVAGNCSGTNKVIGFYADGSKVCGSDITGGGGTGISYWYIQSGLLAINKTKSGTGAINASLGWGNLTGKPANLDTDRTDDYKYSNYSTAFNANTTNWDKSRLDDFNNANWTVRWNLVSGALFKVANWTTQWNLVKGGLYKKENLTLDYPSLDVNSGDDANKTWTNARYATLTNHSVSTGLQLNETGGTMTGDLNFDANIKITDDESNSYIRFEYGKIIMVLKR